MREIGSSMRNVATAVAGLALIIAVSQVVAADVLWLRQIGTPEYDEARGVAAAIGAVYVAGTTSGTLPGQVYYGGAADAFVGKYSAAGDEVWTRQFGTQGDEEANGVASDEASAFVVGWTSGALPGQTNAGGSPCSSCADVFIRRYSADGSESWTRQFGTPETDLGFGVGVGGDSVYVAGESHGTFPGELLTFSLFVTQFTTSGEHMWTHQYGPTPFGVSYLGVAADSSAVYVAGSRSAGGGVVGAFVMRIDSSGSLVWSRVFEAGSQSPAFDVALYGDALFVVGRTNGAFQGQTNAGDYDGYLIRLSTGGELTWIKQFGDAGFEEGRGVAVDAQGVHVGGTVCRVNPPPAQGLTRTQRCDAYVRTYTLGGGEIAYLELGSGRGDQGRDVSLDASGIYLAGMTTGVMPGQGSSHGGGTADAFVAKTSR